MDYKGKAILSVAGLLLLGLPLAYLLTILLMPFWRYLEASTGIESAGHSGPAGWCYSLVYTGMLAACLLGARHAIKKESDDKH